MKVLKDKSKIITPPLDIQMFELSNRQDFVIIPSFFIRKNCKEIVKTAWKQVQFCKKNKIGVHTAAGKVVNELIGRTAEKQEHVNCVAIVIFMRDLTRSRRGGSQGGHFGSIGSFVGPHSPKIATAKKLGKRNENYSSRILTDDKTPNWLKRPNKTARNRHNLRIEVNSSDIEKFKKRDFKPKSSKMNKRTKSEINGIDFSKELKGFMDGKEKSKGKVNFGFLNHFNKKKDKRRLFKYWEKEVLKEGIDIKKGGHVLIVDEGERRQLFK